MSRDWKLNVMNCHSIVGKSPEEGIRAWLLREPLPRQKPNMSCNLKSIVTSHAPFCMGKPRIKQATILLGQNSEDRQGCVNLGSISSCRTTCAVVVPVHFVLDVLLSLHVTSKDAEGTLETNAGNPSP